MSATAAETRVDAHGALALGWAWIAWTGLLLVFLLQGGGTLLAGLLPGAGRNPALALEAGAAFFLLCAAPFGAEGVPRRRVFSFLGALLLYGGGALAFALAVAGRLVPLPAEAIGQALLLLALFALVSCLLAAAAGRWYYPVQLALAGGGPLAAYFLAEMARARGVEAADEAVLLTPSVFAALARLHATGGGWIPTAVFLGVAAAVLALLLPRSMCDCA